MKLSIISLFIFLFLWNQIALNAQEIEELGQVSLEELINSLSSSDLDEQLDSIVEIGSRGKAAFAAAPILVEMLNHQNEWVCLGATEALAKLGPEILDLLPEVLQNKSVKEKKYACRILAEMEKTEKALELIKIALNDSSTKVQVEAIRAAWQYERRAASFIPKIIMLAKSGNPEVLKESILALGEINPNCEEVLQFFTSLFSSQDETVRLLLGEALTKVKPEAHSNLKILLNALSYMKDDYLRAKVLEALGNIKDPTIIQEIISYLNHSNHFVRYQTLKYISKTNSYPRNQFQKLVPLFQDPYEPIRMLIPKVVANLQFQEAVPFLLPMLKDINPRVRMNAVKALGNIFPPSENQVRGLLLALQDVQMNIVHQAVISLGNLQNGSLSAAKTLTRFASVAKGEMLISLLQTLGKIKPPAEKTVPTLNKILERTEEYSKIWCYHTLYQIAPKEKDKAALELLKYLDSKEDKVWGQALRAIVALEAPNETMIEVVAQKYPKLHPHQTKIVTKRFNELNQAHRLEPFKTQEKR